MKRYQTAIGIIVSLIVIFGAGFGAVSYFAKASELHAMTLRVNYGFLEIRANALQERMWSIEKEFGFDKSKWSAKIHAEYMKLKAERDAILRKLDIIFAEMQKKKKG